MAAMILVKTKSTVPRKSAITTTNNKTAELVLMVSCLSGQTTFSVPFLLDQRIRENLRSFVQFPVLQFCFGILFHFVHR
jgi:hypothetical protein